MFQEINGQLLTGHCAATGEAVSGDSHQSCCNRKSYSTRDRYTSQQVSQMTSSCTTYYYRFTSKLLLYYRDLKALHTLHCATRHSGQSLGLCIAFVLLSSSFLIQIMSWSYLFIQRTSHFASGDIVGTSFSACIH